MIDEMVDTLPAMQDALETANKMRKVTDEPSDNASKAAETTIVTSYATIDEMYEMFDGTNEMRNEMTNAMIDTLDATAENTDKANDTSNETNEKPNKTKNERAEMIDDTTDKTKHDIMLTINADEASVETDEEATNGKSRYDDTNDSGVNDKDNDNDGVDDRDTNGTSYEDAHDRGIDNGDDDDHTEAMVNHTASINKNEETSDDKGHYGDADDDGVDNNPKKEMTNN